MSITERPRTDEYAPFYATYIGKVPPGDLLQHLRKQVDQTCRLIEPLSEERARFRYEPGKWSVKQVLGHMIDVERVFAHRALAIARGDAADQPSMDQDLWMTGVDFDARPAAALCSEFRAVRAASCALFGTFDGEVWLRSGRASGNPFTVRSLVCALAGHELHHLGVLRERYGIGG